MTNRFNKSAAIVATTLLLASWASAQTAEVFSLNVVGFQKVTVSPSNTGAGLFLESTPFEQDLSNIDGVVGTNGTAGITAAQGDNVILFDKYTQGYITYWLFSHVNPALNRHWRSGSGLATNVYLYPGMGYWHKNQSGSNLNIVLVGDVVADGTVTNAIVPGLQLISYPFSTSIRMTDMTLTNGTPGTTAAQADNIMLYENQSFVTYWLFSHANPTLHRKWRSGSGLATNVFIQPGRGFWYRSRSAETNFWIEARPYTF